MYESRVPLRVQIQHSSAAARKRSLLLAGRRSQLLGLMKRSPGAQPLREKWGAKWGANTPE
jgi:hypothetical protein